MVGLSFITAVTEGVTDTSTDGFPWTTVITVTLSILLIVALIFLLMPRKKNSPAVKAMEYLVSELKAAENFSANPNPITFKILKKCVRRAENQMLAVSYKGIVELKKVSAMQTESLNICRSLTALKMNDNLLKEFAEVLLFNARRSIEITTPFAYTQVADDPIALSQKLGATAYLKDVKKRYESAKVEEKKELIIDEDIDD